MIHRMPARTPRRIAPPNSLNWTEDPAACRLIADDPVAFVIGFLLDQQVKVQLAFNGPLVLRQRLGHLDPSRIAKMPEEQLVEIARRKPPIHRYPASMAKRIRECMAFLVDRHDGDPTRVWSEATDLADLRSRIAELPGFGAMKAMAVAAVMARQFHMDFPGWDADLPPYGALAYCDSLDELLAYQARKREHKQRARR